jgi:hypothetical protein
LVQTRVERLKVRAVVRERRPLADAKEDDRPRMGLVSAVRFATGLIAPTESTRAIMLSAYSVPTMLLNHVGKDSREIQELLPHKNIRTTVRYTHVGYEQTRQTAEALSQALE